MSALRGILFGYGLLIFGPHLVFAQDRNAQDATNRVMPIASDIQQVRQVPVKLNDKTLVISPQYAIDGATVMPFPVWVLSGKIRITTPDQKQTTIEKGESLDAHGEIKPGSHARIDVRELLSDQGSRTVVVEALKAAITQERGLAGPLHIVDPQVENSSFSFTLRLRNENILMSAPVKLSDDTVDFGSGTIKLPLNAEAFKRNPGITQESLYLRLEGLVLCRFKQEQYRANLDVAMNRLIDLSNKIGSMARDNPVPKSMIFLPGNEGDAEQRQEAANAFSKLVTLDIQVRKGESVDLGAVRALTKDLVNQAMEDIRLADLRDEDRISVVLENLVNISATVDSIKKFSTLDEGQKKAKLTKMLDEYRQRKNGNDVKVDAEFDSAFIMGSAGASADISTNSEETTHDKDFLDQLNQQYSKLSRKFEGNASKLSGISFDQNILRKASSSIRTSIVGSGFTEGLSQRSWLISLNDGVDDVAPPAPPDAPASTADKLLEEARLAVAKAIVAAEKAGRIHSSIDPPPLFDFLIDGTAQDEAGLLIRKGVTPEVFGAWFTDHGRKDGRFKEIVPDKDVRIMTPDAGLRDFYKKREAIFKPLIDGVREGYKTKKTP